MEKKRKQHYVFQSYLASWAENQQIWCYRDGKIFRSNTLNVAQERDFYRVLPINNDELKFFLLMQNNAHPDVYRAMLEHISIYLEPLEWEKQINTLESWLKQKFAKEGQLPTDIARELSKLKNKIDIDINNLMEDYLSDIEGESIQWLTSLKKADTTFYYSSDDEKMKTQGYFDDDRFNFLYFISVQYFRTKALKERWISNFSPSLEDPRWNSLGIPRENIRLENLVPHFTWNFQNACAYHLRKTNSHLSVLINDTDTPFVTSDQPVINLKADYGDLDSHATELIFYYPISPRVAITVNDLNNVNKIVLSQQEVNDYNSYMIKASYQIIFSNSKETIEKYI